MSETQHHKLLPLTSISGSNLGPWTARIPGVRASSRSFSVPCGLRARIPAPRDDLSVYAQHQDVVVGLGAWAGRLGRDGCRFGVVLFTCCCPCSDVVFAESGSADDNNTLSVDHEGKSVSGLIAERSTTLSDMHEVEEGPNGFSRSVVGGERTSYSTTGVSRSSRASRRRLLRASRAHGASSQLLGAP